MSKKHQPKPPSGLQEPLTAEEKRVLNKAGIPVLGSFTLGVILIIFGLLIKLLEVPPNQPPIVLLWSVLGFWLIGFLWFLFGFLPRMLEITKQTRAKAQERQEERPVEFTDRILAQRAEEPIPDPNSDPKTSKH